MNEVIRDHPDTKLVICGTGLLVDELKTAAGAAGVERHVQFVGLVDNARVARYCAAAIRSCCRRSRRRRRRSRSRRSFGTPVLSADNPGGLELNELFGPMSVRAARAAARARQRHRALLRNKRRTLGGTADTLARVQRRRRRCATGTSIAS